MSRLGIFIFQAVCWLLFAALSVFVVKEYGWLMLFILLVQFALLVASGYIATAHGKRLDDAERRIVAQTKRLDDAECSIRELKTRQANRLEEAERKFRDFRIRQHKRLEDVERRIEDVE